MKWKYLNAQLQFDKQNAENVGMGAVFVDANGLKEINDMVGHAKQEISCLSILRRKSCSFSPQSMYRTGGDEFVVLSNHVEENAFLQEAVKLRDSLREFEAGQGDKAAVGSVGPS
ncbi:MAG: diguanylate cyclase domain-containing protein [Enterocloster bolteae]